MKVINEVFIVYNRLNGKIIRVFVKEEKAKELMKKSVKLSILRTKLIH